MPTPMSSSIRRRSSGRWAVDSGQIKKVPPTLSSFYNFASTELSRSDRLEEGDGTGEVGL